MTSPCPDEDTLLDVMEGDAQPAVLAHTEQCISCRQRLMSLRLALNTLRNLFAHESKTPLSPAAAQPINRLTQIGKYLIVGVLDESESAVAYRGLHVALNKEVVLEVGRLPVEAGGLDRAQLIREGTALARLDHPHLAKVIGLDFHEGRPCLVSEYIDGVSLEDYAAARKPTPRQSAGLTAKLASALAAVHREGVVHHAIEMANIVVDDQNQIMLTGLRLACLRRAGGEREKDGPAGDLFALGGVLLFLLTGKPPFSGLDGLDAPGIPRPLAALCRQALSVDPNDRPSAERFAAELEKLARSAKWPIWLLAGGLAAVAAAGTAAWLWW